MYSSAFAYASALGGESTPATNILASLESRALEHYVSPLDIAIVHMGLGNADATFERLDAAFAQRVMRVTEISMPTFDRLRTDPRFNSYVLRLGLAAA